MVEPVKKKKTGFYLFFSAQIAAGIGTAVDFLTTIFLTEVVKIWYLTSIVIGALAGAITNFLLGRYWVFSAKESKLSDQAFRYALVSLGSLALNALGSYILTDYLHFHYLLSKTLVAVTVAVSFNYLLQKNFVYREPQS